MRAVARIATRIVVSSIMDNVVCRKTYAQSLVPSIFCVDIFWRRSTLLNNLRTDGLVLNLGSFGKFSIRHKAGILRRIPFTGKTILTKNRRTVWFVRLGSLRQCEQVVYRD